MLMKKKKVRNLYENQVKGIKKKYFEKTKLTQTQIKLEGKTKKTKVTSLKNIEGEKKIRK
jgi:hypothetical protein